jgi:hypothetical protein
MIALWNIALCSLAELDLHNQGDRPDDGGSTHFWNVGQSALYPRRLSFSWSPLWKPEISQVASYFNTFETCPGHYTFTLVAN